MFKFPKEIDNIVKGLNFSIDEFGRSEDVVYLFEDKYILKISSNKDRLLNEKNKIDYLYGKLPVSKSIIFLEENNKCYYLRTFINGESLISERFINNPEKLIDILVEVIKLLRKLDGIDIPFNSFENSGKAFVHGDLCLPNILVDNNDDIAGFIDLDNAGLGDVWYDYAWVLWSLEYNLKTNKYNEILLQKLQIEFDEEKYNQYIPKEYRFNK